MWAKPFILAIGCGCLLTGCLLFGVSYVELRQDTLSTYRNDQSPVKAIEEHHPWYFIAAGATAFILAAAIGKEGG